MAKVTYVQSRLNMSTTSSYAYPIINTGVRQAPIVSSQSQTYFRKRNSGVISRFFNNQIGNHKVTINRNSTEELEVTGENLQQNNVDTEAFSANSDDWYIVNHSSSSANLLRLTGFTVEPDSGHYTVVGAFGLSSLSENNVTRFMPAQGPLELNMTDVVQYRFPIDIPVILRNFFINIPSNARTTNTTFRVRVNTSNGNGVIVVGSGQTGIFVDNTNTDSVSAGNTFNYSRAVLGSGGAIVQTMIGVEMHSSEDKHHMYGGDTPLAERPTFDSTTLQYFSPFGGFTTPTTTESEHQIPIGHAGTAKQIKLRVQSNTASNGGTIKIRKNGVDVATINITASTTGEFTTSDEFSFDTGDLICASGVRGSGSGSITIVWMSMVIEPAPDTITDSITKSLKYTIFNEEAIKKSLQYNIFIPLSKLETLQDDFNDNSINTALWDLIGSGVSETNEQLELTVDGGSPETTAIKSKNKYDLTDSFAQIEVKDVDNLNIGSWETMFIIQNDDDNQIFFTIRSGRFIAGKVIGGSYSTVMQEVYNTTDYKYVRIREDSGTTYWDISTDGASWENFTSESNPINPTNVELLVLAKMDSESVTNTAIYDNLNILSSTEVVQKSLKYTIASQDAITKSQKYCIVGSDSITKSLSYSVLNPDSITKSLKYSVLDNVKITKSLTYSVIKADSISKDITYKINSTDSISKEIIYTVADTESITKSIKYCISLIEKIEKTLSYRVAILESIQKDIKYTIVGDSTIQKSVRYDIAASDQVSKSLKYCVIDSPSITKSLAYRIAQTDEIQKSSQYAIISENVLQKTTTYRISLLENIEKSLKFCVQTSDSITLGLEYIAYSTEIESILKSLKYCITKENSLTKTLAYVVDGQVTPVYVINKDLTYEILYDPYSQRDDYFALEPDQYTKENNYFRL